jgi:quercetin dioxygenase-like cupin family protein
MIVRLANTEVIQGKGRKLRMVLSPETTGTKELSFLHVEFEPGASNELHTHEGIETMLVLRGGGRFMVDGKSSPFKAGDMLVAPAGVPHQIFTETEGPTEIACTYVPPLPPSFLEQVKRAAAETK